MPIPNRFKLGLGSYQTAWSWLTKIRTAMVRPNREPLAGKVEIDESYVGGPDPANRVGLPGIKPSEPPQWRSAARAAAGFALG